MKTEFFMAVIPPTVTDQMHRIDKVNGKRIVYDSAELKDARAKLMAHLAQHVPDKPYTAGVQLITKWLFPMGVTHKDGEYRISRPDTDNLQKLLKDCMTKCGYWKDDALVCSELVEKFWAATPGIYIRVMPV